MPKILSYSALMRETGIGCQKALIVSRDGDLRGMLKYALDSYGMQVLFYKDGEDVLAFSTIDPFDCIILDCDAPGMDGIDLIRRLRERFEFAIIISLCKEDRGTAHLQAGANDFLQNPFIPYRLAMMLDGRDILV